MPQHAWLLLPTLGVVAAEMATIDTSGGSQSEPNLLLASTWAPLGAVARADLYLAAATAGVLEEAEDLIPCARLMQLGEFQYGSNLVRGVAATMELPALSGCTLGKRAAISLSTVVRRLAHTYGNDPVQSREIASVEALVRTPADERALCAVLLMREAERTSSPLMPYIMALLTGAHEHIPSAWDPGSAEGAARRAGLESLDKGPMLLMAADELRKVIVQQYASLVPRALKTLPNLLGIAGNDIVDAPVVYSIQRFAETWLGMRSRSFEDGAHGVLVPPLCLMNHPAQGEDSVIDIGSDSNGDFVMKTKRHIEQSEQLTYSYGALCAERALLVYGFPVSVWSRLPPCEGF